MPLQFVSDAFFVILTLTFTLWFKGPYKQLPQDEKICCFYSGSQCGENVLVACTHETELSATILTGSSASLQGGFSEHTYLTSLWKITVFLRMF